MMIGVQLRQTTVELLGALTTSLAAAFNTCCGLSQAAQ